jgi:hypothetical protein
MQLDHLSFAATPAGLDETADKLGQALGAQFVDGGFHPRFGTRNQTLALANRAYLEVVEVLDHPAAEKAPFGQAVRSRTAEGGGWLGWVVRVDDLAPMEQRLGREAVVGNRTPPNQDELRWLQLGVKGLQADPQLPFFVHWLTDMSLHPSQPATQDDPPRISLLGLDIAGEPERVDAWLGGKADRVLTDIDICWAAPQGQPGIRAVRFRTPNGEVRI